MPYKLRNDAGSYYDLIKASTLEGEWFIILKKEALLENDVNAFLVESKKLEQRPQRRIIISLSDLDETAKVKALQEKVWIWSEEEFNALLNLYDKPYIVR